LAPFFGDFSQNEKLSEIKPPLVVVRSRQLLAIHQAIVTGNQIAFFFIYYAAYEIKSIFSLVFIAAAAVKLRLSWVPLALFWSRSAFPDMEILVLHLIILKQLFLRCYAVTHSKI
jgi:hypothetical protein